MTATRKTQREKTQKEAYRMAKYPWVQKPLYLLVSWILVASLKDGQGFIVFGNQATRQEYLAMENSVKTESSGEKSEYGYSMRSRIEVESEIELPFSPEAAFDVFADLRRQPSFSHWLINVEYIDGWTQNAVGSRSKWTISVSGFRFSWKSISKQLDRDNGIIEWGSLTGLKNEGKVQFSKIGSNQNTHMRLSMCIFMPKFAARIMGGNKVSKMIENRMLKPTLETFRQHLIRDYGEKAIDNTPGGLSVDPKSSKPTSILAKGVSPDFQPVVPQEN